MGWRAAGEGFALQDFGGFGGWTLPSAACAPEHVQISDREHRLALESCCCAHATLH